MDGATVSSTPGAERIVVGIDGSECSKTALRWAISQARRSGAGLDVVAAWQDPVRSGYSLGWMPGFSDGDNWAAITQSYIDQEVKDVVGELGGPADLTTRVVEGNPAQVLLDAAANATLLVVGSRGHGTLAGVLLGSVGMHCVQHAPCPVVVVR
jgi:nucleotide-binding universal stress UspA family protein